MISLLYLVMVKTIRAKQSISYLGLELNQYLDGEQIVLNTVKKVSSRLKFLYRQANYLQNVNKNSFKKE